MALSLECAPDLQYRHLVTRSRARQPLFASATRRDAVSQRLAQLCIRHRLRCIVWSVTERCLHAVLHGRPAAITLATDEISSQRLQAGHSLSTVVNADLYLLEVARHALLAPVRSGLVRRPVDWPHSSARESYGLAPAPAWLDVTPLHDLLGPRDGRGCQRFRLYLES